MSLDILGILSPWSPFVLGAVVDPDDDRDLPTHFDSILEPMPDVQPDPRYALIEDD